MDIKFEPKKAEVFKIAEMEKIYNGFLWKFLRTIVWILGFLSVIVWIVEFLKIVEIQNQILGFSIVLISIALFVLLIHNYYIYYLKLIPKKLTKEILKNQNINLAEYLSIHSARAIKNSLREAKKNNSHSLEPIFLLLGLLKNKRINYLLLRAGINLNLYFQENPNLLNSITKNQEIYPEKFLEVLVESMNFAILEGNQQIEIGDLFYGLSQHNEFLQKICVDLNLQKKDIANIIYWEKSEWDEIENRKKFISSDFWDKSAGIGRDWAYGYVPHLNMLAYDLSETIKRVGLGLHVIGHKTEIDEIERILTRSSKNNVILVGEPGVGKKTIVLGFTENVRKNRVANELRFKRIMQLDLGRLLSGNPEEIENKIITTLNEAVSAGNIILFIDDIHNIFGGETTKIGAIDASEIILPYLQSSKLQLIGTTSYEEYHKYIEQNSAVTSDFEKIEVKEPSQDETIRIMEDIVPYIEGKNKVLITYESLKEIYNLANRYISNRPFPEKAIDLLDEAGVYVSTKTGEKIVTPKHIQELVSQKTKIPTGEVQETEKEKLLNLESILHKRVVGQNEAITAISQAMRRSRTGLKTQKKPIGTFLFLGPTGVGKTETARALAENYFGSETAMSRLDMSEFKGSNSIDRLIGTADGGEGILTTQIKENPFCLLLLDEIEKAHPDILNLFLSILDEGRLTDRLGRNLDFTNTIIIATSNAGAELIRESIKTGETQEILREKLLEYLQSQGIFRPEFLNRFDGVISFKPLSQTEIYQVAGLIINKLANQLLKEKEVILKVDPDAIQKLSELGYDPEMGARPMQRVIQDKLENWLADKMLKNEIQKGQTIEYKLTDIS
jgi:ATP-dependent Clp protease ATP-binding subunit ClpC